MVQADLPGACRETVGHGFGNRDRPVPASGTADPDRQVAPLLVAEPGEEVRQEIFEATDELAESLVSMQEALDFGIRAGSVPQFRDEVRKRTSNIRSTPEGTPNLKPKLTMLTVSPPASLEANSL